MPLISILFPLVIAPKSTPDLKFEIAIAPVSSCIWRVLFLSLKVTTPLVVTSSPKFLFLASFTLRTFPEGFSPSLHEISCFPKSSYKFSVSTSH